MPRTSEVRCARSAAPAPALPYAAMRQTWPDALAPVHPARSNAGARSNAPGQVSCTGPDALRLLGSGSPPVSNLWPPAAAEGPSFGQLGSRRWRPAPMLACTHAGACIPAACPPAGAHPCTRARWPAGVVDGSLGPGMCRPWRGTRQQPACTRLHRECLSKKRRRGGAWPAGRA